MNSCTVPLPKNPKIGLLGSTLSSRQCLNSLIAHGLRPQCVFGLAREASSTVSGYVDLNGEASKHDIDYVSFRKVTDPIVSQTLTTHSLDLLFIVGISQLVPSSITSLVKGPCIGFHPTLLPRGRGRAPLAWLILEKTNGAATFFIIDQGVDSGAIVAQVPFEVTEVDNAGTLMEKTLIALDQGIKNLSRTLRSGTMTGHYQDESNATYRAVRRPEDGVIEWERSADEIEALVKASTNPHPGAFTYFNDQKVIIWDAQRCDKPWKGVPGRVVDFQGKNPLIQTGGGSS